MSQRTPAPYREKYAAAKLPAVLLMLSVGMFLAGSLRAQTITATLSAFVKDPQGAAVTNAGVTVTAAESGARRTCTTDSDGRCSVPFLPPGAYGVVASAKGFGKVVRNNIVLEVAQVAEVDLSLPLDIAAETIVVTSDVPSLVTEASHMEATVENKLITELPSGERSTIAFINLIPGAIDGGFALAQGENLNTNGNAQGPIGTAGNRNFFDSNFSVSGGQASTNDVLLDGVSDTIGDFNGIAVSPPQDSVREFKVLSGAIPAEYGRTGTAVVNFITRAGTSKFHGTLYEYFQNGDLNANGWQRNRRGSNSDGSPVLPRIGVKRNQFGAALGGPVTVPRVAKLSQTYFFFNYEGRREKNPFSKQLTLPTAKMRTGDLSELLTGGVRAGQTDPNGSPSMIGQIYDPFAPLINGKRSPIPGNRLDLLPKCGSAALRPSACLDPVAFALLKFVPLPNQPGLTDNYNYSGTADFGRDLFAARIDRTISQNHSVFGRVSIENRLQAEPSFLNSLASNSRKVNDTFYNVTVNEVWVVGPSIVNNFRYGYTRAHAHQILLSEGTDPADTLGLPKYIGAASPIPTFPIFNFSSAGAEGQGLPGEITSGQISGGGNNQPRDTQTVADTISRIHGGHTIKGGVEFRLLRFFANQYTNPDGTFTFNRTFTRGPVPGAAVPNATDTGSSLASLLLGLPNAASQQAVTPLTLYHHYGAVFLQDDWRATSRLTLNAGVRWDFETPTAEAHNQVALFDPSAKSPLAGTVSNSTDPAVLALRGSYATLPGLLSFPDGPQGPTHYRRFAPRIGAALRVDSNTSLRAGYALVFVPISVEQTTAIGNVYTTAPTQSDNTVQVIQPGGTAQPTYFLANPFQSGISPPPGNTLGASTLLGSGITIVTPNRPSPYNQQWNFVVQRRLFGNLTVDLAYVGSHGINLPVPNVNLNQISPQYLDAARADFAKYGAASAAAFFSAQVPNPFAAYIPTAGSALRAATITRQQLLLPFPQYTTVTDFRPHVGSLSYNALQLSVQKRYSAGLSMTGSYVWSKSIDIGSPGNGSGNSTTIENIYNIRGERSLSNFDVPHRVVVGAVWELPFFKSSKSTVARALLRGWQTSGTATWQRGTPISIITSGFLNFGLRRPDRASGGAASYDIGLARENARNGKPWFDTSLFSTPPDFRLGTAARNYGDVRRDDYRNLNLSLARNFSFRGEKVKLQFRGEFLNAFNMVVFGTPGRDVSVPATFGILTTQGNTPRNIQAVLRLTF